MDSWIHACSSQMEGDDGLNLGGWSYYGSSPTPPVAYKNSLGLDLMTSMVDQKPLIGGRDPTVMANVNGGFHQRDFGAPSSHYGNPYMREAWIHRDNKLFNMMPRNLNYAALPETTPVHHYPVQMIRQPESSNDERMVHVEASVCDSSNSPAKKRSVGKAEKAPKAKKSKKAPNDVKDGNNASAHRAKAARKPAEVVINGIDMDISSIPVPVCSCTGAPQQCYRWGCGGWQSACCTTQMSVYPLPMSSKRRGARIAGRKMSLGAFKKVLEKLAAEGYNFSNPIDLKTYWAKHGTNKFVTIR